LKNNIAITGATGLLGANLANKLQESGSEVFALIKDEESRSILSPKINRIYGNINSKSDIEYFIHKSNPQHFLHLAAQTQAYDSLKYPYQTFYNNIVGTLNILDSLREYASCSSILVASSDKAYGELIGKKYSETHPLKGIYPYDASKSSTDLIANSYRQTYKMPIITTRACNIYGIGDFNKQRLIPGLIHSHKSNSEFVIRNKGLDLREYIHVEDVVDAYILLMEYAENENRFGSFNISASDAHSTLEIFELVQNAIGSKIKHKISSEITMEIREQFMDASLIKKETNWQPKLDLKGTINQITNWYLNSI
jgi:CDP-glucose 4,6-dehydratase